MIKVKASRHDDRSIELKFGFSSVMNDGGEQKVKPYSVNTWIFIPGSLHIDPETYGKNQFYRDIKSNFRLISPSYKLDAIASVDSFPLASLRKSIERLKADPGNGNPEAFECQIKMFAVIVKSSLRDHSNLMCKVRDPKEIDSLGLFMNTNVKDIIRTYGNFCQDVNEFDPKYGKFMIYGYEYILRQVEFRCGRILRKGAVRKGSDAYSALTDLLVEVRESRKNFGFKSFSADNSRVNSDLAFHYGMLKKYVESDLYIKLNKKRDGFAVEQLYYSIAAGLAMIFATSIGWIFQLRFGNITGPLFIALVISYMLKDRIKELMRYYFAHKRLNRFFDHKSKINIGRENVGLIKEGVDFISREHAPQEVIGLRLKDADVEDEDVIFEENVLLFRNLVEIDHAKLREAASYPVNGINQILRLHFTRFTFKMDNPSNPMEVLDPDNVAVGSDIPLVRVPKNYKVRIVVQLKEKDSVSYRCFSVVMNRDGIVSLKTILPSD